MRGILATVAHDYAWIHASLGLLGNLLFFIGSFLFLPAFEAWRTAGVWLFIAGSGLMLVGAAGTLLIRTIEPE